MSGAVSIFEAYRGAIERINPEKDDIIILCHDDIEILSPKEEFLEKLTSLCNKEGVGFVGPAGTTYLGSEAVWWNHDNWQKGLHKGRVFHFTPDGRKYNTDYGPHGEVVVLDGLFLAARGHIFDQLNLHKPSYFQGEWDFYDIYYTTQAINLGYINHTLDLEFVHHSRGELVGRDSWYNNKAAFIAYNDLPLDIKKLPVVRQGAGSEVQ